jgi:predicted transcriptional regulator
MTTTMTVRLPVELKKRMERLARSTSRSRAWLAVDAIETYVSLNEWQVQAIKEGIADADAGRVVPHDEVMAMMRSWGGKKRERTR